MLLRAPVVSALLSCVALQCIPARSMCWPCRPALRQEHPVGRAPDAGWASVEDVRVHHRRGHISMAQEFLHSADIVTVFEQVGGEGVAERVAGGPLGDTGGQHSVLHGTLEDRFMQVMAATLAGHLVHVGARGWEDPLPSPLTTRVGILAREGPRQLNPAGALPQISLVLLAHPRHVADELGFQYSRQHGHPVHCCPCRRG